jgi:pectinesterase
MNESNESCARVSGPRTTSNRRPPWRFHPFTRSPLHPFVALLLFLVPATTFAEPANLKPDITVAADGSGDFKTVQEAVAKIPHDNHERAIVLIKNGTYNEKVRIDAPCVTLRGESRNGAKIEFSQLSDDFQQHPDQIGRAVVNIRGDDCVLENLTITNTAGVIGKHAFAVFGEGDRTIILNCDVLSEGNDTVSLWNGKSGRYYHAGCNFRGSVDFVCPRGWCYLTDCNFYEVKNTAAVWHDGHVDKDMKYVLRACKFDGVPGWRLARHHADAQFYFLDCHFSQTMADSPPLRVIYPLGSAPATDADKQRNAQLDRQNQWGERAYYYNCHRDGGDYAWFKNNLDEAPGSPKPEQITANWTFADTWNPERKTGPIAESIMPEDGKLTVKFSEKVTVRGKPTLAFAAGATGTYESGSGSNTLRFSVSGELPTEASSINLGVAKIEHSLRSEGVDLNGGAIVASEADATISPADFSKVTWDKK